MNSNGENQLADMQQLSIGLEGQVKEFGLPFDSTSKPLKMYDHNYCTICVVF